MAEYWCVVALNYDRQEAYIMAKSDDAIDAMIFDEGDYLFQYGDDWLTKVHRPGLYRLTVTFPIGDDGEIDLDDDFEYHSVECLCEFPPLISTNAADHFTTINQRMRQISRNE